MKRTKKQCECCGAPFYPHKRRPDQRFCKKIECIRLRQNKRTKLHYRRNIGNPVWRNAHMRRKKRERLARLERENITVNQQKVLSDIQMILPGMIALFSGAGSREKLMEIMEKCRSFGKDLNNKNEYKVQYFAKISSHNSFESEEEVS